MSSVTGWWTLLSWTQNYDDGRKVVPFGEGATGRLIYDEGGSFAVLISRPDRAPFTTGSQWTAAEQERARAYDGMLAYYGRYEFDGTMMSHFVEASLYPNWIGQIQRRAAKIEGDLLTLGARLEDATPEARTAELVWRRLTR